VIRQGIRLRRGDRLVVASHNPGKVREIRDLLAPYGIEAVGAADIGLPEPEETGATFADNARLKAEAAANASGLPALADDSGLCVSALGGAPGVHSARWALASSSGAVGQKKNPASSGEAVGQKKNPASSGEAVGQKKSPASSSEAVGQQKSPDKDFSKAMARIEKELGGNPDRHAMFACALALAAPGKDTEIFEGRVFGSLTFPPRGDKGFGYDPIFVPEGGRFTFGEMHPDAKHAISHRARAFAKFAKAVLA
jgi:XTP/dITP diphosphohydrolase